MPEVTIAITTGLICVFALCTQRVADYDISPAMIFITAGIVVAIIRDAVPVFNITREAVLILSEIALSTILFHDASAIQFSTFDPALPGRLLGIGLPLTVLFTFLLVWGILPEIGFSGALFLAGILSPTDAGLGAPTILNPKVPSLVRQGLNVESGLNDGIVTPIVFIALSGLENAGQHFHAEDVLNQAIYPFLIAVAIAVVVGPLHAILVDTSYAREWTTAEGRALSMAVAPIFIYGISQLSGAILFVAEFTAGALFGYYCTFHNKDEGMVMILEGVTDFLGNIVWFLSGEFLVAAFRTGFRWQWVVVAVAALVPLRTVPVFVSLAGSGLDWRSKAFVAWFGPRGMATIVFVLMAVIRLSDKNTGSAEHLTDGLFVGDRLNADLVGPALLTVLVSVFAHGLSATPLVDYLATDREQRQQKESEAQKARYQRWDPPLQPLRVRRGVGRKRKQRTVDVILQSPSSRSPPTVEGGIASHQTVDGTTVAVEL